MGVKEQRLQEYLPYPFSLPLVHPTTTIAVLLVAEMLACNNVYLGFTSGDYYFASESLAYIMMLFVIFPLYAGILTHKDMIVNNVEEMDKDFKYICSLGSKHRKRFLATQLVIWKFFILWFCLIIICTIVYATYPGAVRLIETALGSANPSKLLVFPVRLAQDDAYRTPNYQILYALEVCFILEFNLNFTGYVYAQFHVWIHNYIILDMVILDFQSLFDGLDESVVTLSKHHPRRVVVQMTLNKRLGRIVTWHHSVFRAIKTISSYYRPPLVYQLTVSALVICLITYQIARKLDDNEYDILFILIGIIAVLQLWIPCYLGTFLRNKGFAVGAACWECGWERSRLGRLVRTELTLVLLRAQQPINIKYTGLPFVELETFSAVLSTSYSYFNMLRQSSK